MRRRSRISCCRCSLARHRSAAGSSCRCFPREFRLEKVDARARNGLEAPLLLPFSFFHSLFLGFVLIISSSPSFIVVIDSKQNRTNINIWRKEYTKQIKFGSKECNYSFLEMSVRGKYSYVLPNLNTTTI